MSLLKSKFPKEFDVDIYFNHLSNIDIKCLNIDDLRSHYNSFGESEGRICNVVPNRKSFLNLVPRNDSLLEIGPFSSPSFKRPEHDVYYLDCIPTKEMLQRACDLENMADKMTGIVQPFGYVPKIDYVWTGQNYFELTNRKFKVIYSSHNVEHHPCLISHIQNLELVLAEEGVVFLVVPDKRYCFDHFFPESKLSEVLDIWRSRPRRHRLKNILDHYFFSAHNDPVRHWAGDHGIDKSEAELDSGHFEYFMTLVEEYSITDEYLDVHAWKFTPESFLKLLNDLYNLEIIRMRVIRVYPTVKNNNEFYAILMCGEEKF